MKSTYEVRCNGTAIYYLGNPWVEKSAEWSKLQYSDRTQLETYRSFLFSMPICIECRFPVNTLYTSYSKADDRSLGKGVRLTQCPRCKRFADKYVEHDFVVLFIDLVLIKPQVQWQACIMTKSYSNVYRRSTDICSSID